MRLRQLFAPHSSRTLAPVYVYSDEKRRRRLPEPPPSLWALLLAWIKYHATQIRWDIERAIARLLRRRW
ncbi:hypothetical protein EI42_06218 [Thermosporothrix hazakensis]|jgi:hypothetical protein|uniref:Uncharacterized protein n=2 Tax=Thermosporothrix TaxID=768650 RepID=A0A326TPC5_THEHA|nr:hypothetical protein [Thermosporothrix hazakensis]PZW18343.1 hypothetical protein EI42_06218 [Thermosporothrix hazakensis]BBH90376.1 hypothetical protein KTC_51270 [Thermosporothrix sp. COM3]GCE48414.1 hypothetical protein KTH_32830 [Thermosporothrix hazakensis]